MKITERVLLAKLFLAFTGKHNYYRKRNERKGRRRLNDGLRELVDRLGSGGALTPQEYTELLRFRDGEVSALLLEHVEALRKSGFGNELYPMGTIDISSYCKNNCYYCGLRRENRFAQRYRLEINEIMKCCENGWSKGIRSVLLQGGEDLLYTPDKIADIISEIRRQWSDIAIFLSLGEKSMAVYEKWKRAGADGYILCCESSKDSAYRKLHPAKMSLLRRKQCLWELKELGYILGSGFLIGTPYQKVSEMAEEFLFLRQLAPELVLTGTFLPADGTPFEGERMGLADLTDYMISLLRLTFPNLYLPVAQSLAAIDKDGNVNGVRAGADVILTDLTPADKRQEYHCFRKRLLRGKIGIEDFGSQLDKLEEAGYAAAGIDRKIARR